MVKITMKYILNQYILPSKQIIRERIEPTILFLFIPIFIDVSVIPVSAMNSSIYYFHRAIILLISISFIPFLVAIYFLAMGKGLEETILKLPSLTMSILPLYIPILWVAYSSNKKIYEMDGIISKSILIYILQR